MAGAGRDVWRPALVVDREGGVVVVWSENRDGNFDLYRRRYDPATGRWSDESRLTTNPGSDSDPALIAAPDGTVWVAWQSWVEGRADIWLAKAEAGAAGRPVSEGPGNDWSPALTVDKRGNLSVAYDTYRAGNYDVVLRRCGTDGAPGASVAIANSPRYEVRPSVATDPRGRIWVAYEERTENWGKDAENLTEGQGTTLYRQSAVRVRCVDGDEVLDAPDPVAEAPAQVRSMNGFPRLACDARGRVWLALRHRQEAVWGNNTVMVVGGVWIEYVTSLGGPSWEPLRPLTRSDGLLDNRPALVAEGEGPLLVVYNSDGRLHREVELTPELAAKYYTHSGTPPGVVNNDLFLAAVNPPSGRGRSGDGPRGAEGAGAGGHPSGRGGRRGEDARLPGQDGGKDVPPAPRRLPPAHRDLAGRRLRRRARRHVALRDRRRRARLDGQRRPR